MSKSRNIADLGSNDVLETDANGVTVTGGVASDTLNVDSGTLFVDGADNRVGVGTSSPNRKLKVQDSVGTVVEVSSTGTVGGGISMGDSNTSPNAVRLRGEGNSMTFTTDNSEAARIDSSGNLLVGTTSGLSVADSNNTGLSFYSDGRIVAARSGNPPLFLNRLDSDGDIVQFRRGGSTVGSIGVEGGLLWMSSENGAGFRLVNDDLRPGTNEGINNDNSLDLGDSNARWKDLYLSGGIYLGGTGSANYLDDYEEGTWTPTADDGTLSASRTRYEKIGDIVIVSATVDTFTSRIGNGISVRGLPFSPNASNASYIGSTRTNNNTKTAVNCVIAFDQINFIEANGSRLDFSNIDSSSTTFTFSIIYRSSP